MAERLARGQVPGEIQAAIRMGRLTALRKADGGVRGIGRRSQIGCAHNVSAIDGRSAAGDGGSVSECHGNEGSVRMHFACVASTHRVEPQCNDFVSARHECV